MPELSKKGKVVLREGKYFLEAPGNVEQIQIAAAIDPAQLKELVGQEVEILYSEPKVFAVGLVGTRPVAGVRPPRIICYIPAVTDIGVIAEEARLAFADQLLKEGVLSKENYERLTGVGE
jgi:hypothetical protein